MKTIITVLCLCIATCSVLRAETNVSSVAKQVIGEWIAGETMMPQPPKEMRQDIKTISFQTNGIVQWSEVKQGKVVDQIGRYEFLPNDLITKVQSKRGLPTITVASTNSPRPCLSGICLLSLREVEIDYDSRFHINKIGAVLKAETPNGKKVIFVKLKERQPTKKSTLSSEGAPSDER